MFDDADLHRHDVQLLAGFFADGMFTATAGTGQFVFGQFMDNFDTRQLSRQRLAFATARCRCDDFFIGVLGWMPDVALFMQHVASTLKPGGTLVMYETHPFLEVFDPRAQNPFLPASSYFQREPFVLQESIVYEGQGEIAGPTSYWYVHTLGDVVSAAISAQLQIGHLQEYAHSNREELYDQYEDQPAQLPMCFTLTATKRLD